MLYSTWKNKLSTQRNGYFDILQEVLIQEAVSCTYFQPKTQQKYTLFNIPINFIPNKKIVWIKNQTLHDKSNSYSKLWYSLSFSIVFVNNSGLINRLCIRRRLILAKPAVKSISVFPVNRLCDIPRLKNILKIMNYFLSYTCHFIDHLDHNTPMFCPILSRHLKTMSNNC